MIKQLEVADAREREVQYKAEIQVRFFLKQNSMKFHMFKV